MTVAGSFLFDCAVMSSIIAACASAPPFSIASCQRFSIGSAIISGSPWRISAMTPMPSE